MFETRPFPVPCECFSGSGLFCENDHFAKTNGHILNSTDFFSLFLGQGEEG